MAPNKIAKPAASPMHHLPLPSAFAQAPKPRRELLGESPVAPGCWSWSDRFGPTAGSVVLCPSIFNELRCFKQQKHLLLAWRVGFSQRMGPWKFNALRSASLSSAKKTFLPRSKQSRVSPRVTVPWIRKDMIICRLLFLKEGFSGISVKYSLWDIYAAF